MQLYGKVIVIIVEGIPNTQNARSDALRIRISSIDELFIRFSENIAKMTAAFETVPNTRMRQGMTNIYFTSVAVKYMSSVYAV